MACMLTAVGTVCKPTADNLQQQPQPQAQQSQQPQSHDRAIIFAPMADTLQEVQRGLTVPQALPRWILWESQDCPHCQNLRKYLSELPSVDGRKTRIWTINASTLWQHNNTDQQKMQLSDAVRSYVYQNVRNYPKLQHVPSHVVPIATTPLDTLNFDIIKRLLLR